MARVYAKTGDTEQALTNYREASAMFIEAGDEDNYGETILAIADLQLRSGKVMQAAATYEVGLDYIKQPNARQKLMKKLLGLRNRLTGGGLPPVGETADSPGSTNGDAADEDPDKAGAKDDDSDKGGA
jgi:tetratricopeptide (TPR) repeat protein